MIDVSIHFIHQATWHYFKETARAKLSPNRLLENKSTKMIEQTGRKYSCGPATTHGSAWPPWNLELRTTDPRQIWKAEAPSCTRPAIPPPSLRQGGGESSPTAKRSELGDLVNGDVWSDDDFYGGVNRIRTQREYALVCWLRKIQILFIFYKINKLKIDLSRCLYIEIKKKFISQKLVFFFFK